MRKVNSSRRHSPSTGRPSGVGPVRGVKSVIRSSPSRRAAADRHQAVHSPVAQQFQRPLGHLDRGMHGRTVELGRHEVAEVFTQAFGVLPQCR